MLLIFLLVILTRRPRLTQPDPPSRIQTLLRRGSKFWYSGRTLRQTQKAELDRPDHNFTRYACLSVCSSLIPRPFPTPVFTPSLLSLGLHTASNLNPGQGGSGSEASLSHNRTLCYIFYYWICMLKCSLEVSTMLYYTRWRDNFAGRKVLRSCSLPSV